MTRNVEAKKFCLIPTDDISQEVPGVEGRLVITCSLVEQKTKAVIDAIVPLEGTFEERLLAFNQRLDKLKGPGQSGWTSVSGIIMASREYGYDVVQAVIDSGRLSF